MDPEDSGGRKKTLSEGDIVSKLVPARRSALAALSGAAGAFLASGTTACATPQRGDDKDPSDRRGGGRFTDRDPNDRQGGTRPPGLYGGPSLNTPIHGKVGLPLEVGSRATCEGGGWNASRLEVVTGGLPPGLRFNQSNLGIQGVPTRAGTWYLRVRWTGITCAGKNYNDVTQDLTIITEGSSVPGSVR